MTASRRRLLPEQRSRQLLEVAARHFAAKPYHEVAMCDIAGQAGVSRALVYRYYPTKRNLFAAVYQDAADQVVLGLPSTDGSRSFGWSASSGWPKGS